MLKSKLLHPEILYALGKAGHGSQILIADSNYSFSVLGPPSAARVYLNVAPGLVSATDMLRVLLDSIPVELAAVMLRDDGSEAPIIASYREMLGEVPVLASERFAFYERVKEDTTCLIIATGEQRLYANILLTIGVVLPEA